MRFDLVLQRSVFEDGLLHRERIYADRFAAIAATGALDALVPAMDGR